ncbi:MAG TPA: glycosyltransferase, partial [Solirubrobacteraceae bacterium]|nr:glycosyltransferase [Solirubrobacteraceae bacterium]
AMACATPVVAVAEGGLVETVRHDDTGLLVARDPAALGGALARVLDDPQLAGRLGAAGRARVVADWSWERTAADFDARLAALAARGPRS